MVEKWLVIQVSSNAAEELDRHFSLRVEEIASDDTIGVAFRVSRVLLQSIITTPSKTGRLAQRLDGRNCCFLALCDGSITCLRLSGDGTAILDGQEHLFEIRASDLRHAVRSGDGGVFWGDAMHHFRAPSGKHCNGFVRVGDVIASATGLETVAFWLAPHLTKAEAVLLDSWSFYAPVARALLLLAADRDYSHARAIEMMQRPPTEGNGSDAVASTGGGAVHQSSFGDIPVLALPEYPVDEEAVVEVLDALEMAVRRRRLESPGGGRSTAVDTDLPATVSVVVSISATGGLLHTLASAYMKRRAVRTTTTVVYSFSKVAGRCELLAPLDDLGIRFVDEANCRECDRKSQVIEIDPSRFSPASPAERHTKLTPGVVRPVGEFLRRYGTIPCIFDLHVNRHSAHYAVWVSFSAMAETECYEVRLQAVLSEGVNVKPHVVLTVGETSRSLGDKVAALLGGPDVLTLVPPYRHIPDDGKLETFDNGGLHVVVVADVVSRGHRLQAVNRLLRERLGQRVASVVFLVGLARPGRADDYISLRSALGSHRGRNSSFVPVEEVYLPPPDRPPFEKVNCPWCREAERIRGKVGELPNLVERFGQLSNSVRTADAGVPAFLRTSAPLAANSVLGPEGMDIVGVHVAVASSLQRLREGVADGVSRLHPGYPLCCRLHHSCMSGFDEEPLRSALVRWVEEGEWAVASRAKLAEMVASAGVYGQTGPLASEVDWAVAQGATWWREVPPPEPERRLMTRLRGGLADALDRLARRVRGPNENM